MDVKAYRAFDPEATVELVPTALADAGIGLLESFIGYAVKRGLLEEGVLIELLCTQLHALSRGREAEPGPLGNGGDELRQVYTVFLRCELNVSEEAWQGERGVRMLKTAATEAYYLTRYAMAKSLEVSIGQRDAIAQMKRFMDWRIEQLPPVQDPPADLRAMRDRDIPWNVDDQGQDAVSALLSEYQLLKKVTACRIHHVLAPYGDREMMQVVACYPDHAAIRRTNRHFSLTRTQTLIGGAGYCDTCFHDGRNASDFAHPRADVFDALDYAEEG